MNSPTPPAWQLKWNHHFTYWLFNDVQWIWPKHIQVSSRLTLDMQTIHYFASTFLLAFSAT